MFSTMGFKARVVERITHILPGGTAADRSI